MNHEPQIVRIGVTRVGLGVFACCELEVDQLVAEIRGRIVIDGDYGSEYCVDLGDDATLEPGEPFRFLNHSCDPNCELILWRSRRVHSRRISRLWLQTTRAIAAGDELTIDYAWPADAAIRCDCQSKNCRGWIVHPDQLGQLLPTRPRTSRRRQHAPAAP